MPRKVKIVAESEPAAELVFPPFDSVVDCPKCGVIAPRGWKYCGPPNNYGTCRSHAMQPQTGPLLHVLLTAGIAIEGQPDLTVPLPVDREHMHKFCICGYEWVEETADHLAPWADRPAWLP